MSTPLARPGGDGLARHVPEIERLAVVGRTVVARSGGLFAAAVTAAGARTWLLYAADPTPVDFVDGDYALTATVSSDPTWDAYRAVYPTPAETAELLRHRAESSAVAAARSATHAAVKSLRSSGVDLSRPAAVRYAVTIPTEASEPFATRATAAGLRAEGGRWVRDDLPDLALIVRTERWLIGEAARAGGRYDGWTAAGEVSSPGSRV